MKATEYPIEISIWLHARSYTVLYSVQWWDSSFFARNLKIFFFFVLKKSTCVCFARFFNAKSLQEQKIASIWQITSWTTQMSYQIPSNSNNIVNEPPTRDQHRAYFLLSTIFIKINFFLLFISQYKTLSALLNNNRLEYYSTSRTRETHVR